MSHIKSPVSEFLVKIFYICALFPFVSPLPINTDTQPLCLITAMLIVGAGLLFGGVSRMAGVLLLLTIGSLIYINPFTELTLEPGKYVSLFAGIIMLTAATALKSSEAYRIVKAAILIYFTYSCLIYLNTDFFLGLQEHFVRAVNVDESSGLLYRGAPALATEPGLLGGLLVFITMQLSYFAKLTGASAREKNFYIFIVFLTILMTKSGSGYLYFALCVLLLMVERSPLKVLIIFLSLVALALPFIYTAKAFQGLDVDNRGVEVLVGVANGRTFSEDTSVLKRTNDLAIGLIGLVDRPIGVGANNVDDIANEIAFDKGLLREQDYGGRIGLVSGLSWILLAYGLAGLAFIAYIFFGFSKASFIHKFFALLFLSISYSPAFPAIWVLLAQPKIEDKTGQCSKHSEA